MQVAKSVGKVEVRSATEVKSRAENDLAATTEKPIAAAASLPAAEIAPTGGTPKPTSQSADAPVASGPVPGPAPPSRGARQLDNNEIAMLVRRGKDFLKVGDLATSRLLLQRAATAGSAEATFILGTTFDPQFMRRMGVVGWSPTSLARESGTRELRSLAQLRHPNSSQPCSERVLGNSPSLSMHSSHFRSDHVALS